IAAIHLDHPHGPESEGYQRDLEDFFFDKKHDFSGKDFEQRGAVNMAPVIGDIDSSLFAWNLFETVSLDFDSCQEQDHPVEQFGETKSEFWFTDKAEINQTRNPDDNQLQTDEQADQNHPQTRHHLFHPSNSTTPSGAFF